MKNIFETTIFAETEEFVEKQRAIQADVLRSIRDLERNKGHLLGEGNAANVFYPEKGSSETCFKIFHDEAFPMPKSDEGISNWRKRMQEKRFPFRPITTLGNRPAEEARITNKARKVLEGNDVKVPFVYAHFDLERDFKQHDMEWEDKAQVLFMERMNGFDVKTYIEERLSLPEDFNIDIFFKKVRDAVDKLQEQKIYHRDIHWGNIMVLSDGNPALIDYGFSTDVVFSDENPFREIKTETKEIHRYKDDDDGIEEVEKQLRDYLETIDR